MWNFPLFLWLKHCFGTCISCGHPCLWTLCRNNALSFGEGVGGKSSAGRRFATSLVANIFWCPFIDFHIGANFILDRNQLDVDTKKRGIVVLSIPHTEALVLPIKIEQTTSEPTPIWVLLPKETYIIMWLGPSREQSMLTRSPQGWYNHTRDIHRWLYSRLWYCGLQDFCVPQTQCRVNAFNMSWTIFPPKPALHWCLATYYTLRGVVFTNAFMRTCPFIAFLKKL